MTLIQILIDVAAGVITPTDAEVFVRQVTTDRNAFAAAAVTGYIASGKNFGDPQTLAAKSFEQADALMAAALVTAAGGQS